MKPSDCKALLAELNIRPTKSLGQNFLVDSNILDIIARAAQLRPDDIIVEIGPGLGSLTTRLVSHAQLVIAVEKDARLHAWLRQQFAAAPNLQLLCADALEVPIKHSASFSGVRSDQLCLPDDQFKVVANLPYSISSPLLERFVENAPRPTLMTLTLQREMAERLAATPASKQYGALTLFTQLYYHVTVEHIVSPRCFYPAPDVESAVVTLDRRESRTHLSSNAPFKPLVRAAFSQRRKMLRKLLLQSEGLRLDAERIDAAFEKLGIAATARGEELSLERFIELANEFV
jgi:16S rRNA (adenine1518-N6/adenine1519-N6)-dimethyltransferase